MKDDITQIFQVLVHAQVLLQLKSTSSSISSISYSKLYPISQL